MMAITTSLFVSSFTRHDNSTSFKRNQLRLSLKIYGQVNKKGGSKRRVIFVEDTNKLLADKSIARKCSHCRQVGHNSRTCQDAFVTTVFWTTSIDSQSTRDRSSFGNVVCQRCKIMQESSTVFFCEQNVDSIVSRNESKNLEIIETEKSSRLDSFKEKQLKTSAYLANIGRLSRMTYKLDGKTKVEVCVKCSGTTLMVCPRCRGEPMSA
ncbi:hypothetical protein Gasu2_62020 [Galdieria sulphuraria]|nr:hypothetical protein Gasu2_62020 [Galdieria sulphuraria]